MALHFRQAFDTSPPPIATLDHTRLLRGLFMQAVGYAIASSLAAAGCGIATPADGSQQGVRPVDPPAQSQADASNQQQPMAAMLEKFLANGSAATPPGDASAGGPALAGRGPSSNVASGAGGASGARAAAAGTGAPTKGGSRAVPVTVECSNSPAQLFAGLTPAEPFDAAEFLIQAATTIGPQHAFGQGVLCAKAADVMACQKAVVDATDQTKLPYADYLPMYGMVTRYVVTSYGDEVEKYQSREELLQFLGPIDSPQDALLLLYYDHRTILCGVGASGVDPASIREVDDGYDVTFVEPSIGCEATVPQRWNLHVSRGGVVTEAPHDPPPIPPPCSGRRPAGLRSEHRKTSASAVGEHFARMAHLEHASVAAFEMLATELEQHGAPAALIEAARAAAADEVRHTTITAELARTFGALPRTAEVAAREARSLEAIAIDNATEGCVRECFGAAFGWYQARTAADAEIAAAMTLISEDETRHAALSFVIDAWLCAQLDDAGRARVAEAKSNAVRTLRSELASHCGGSASAKLGLPNAAAALTLCSVLERSVWV